MRSAAELAGRRRKVLSGDPFPRITPFPKCRFHPLPEDHSRNVGGLFFL
jgi:hypothetical protein